MEFIWQLIIKNYHEKRNSVYDKTSVSVSLGLDIFLKYKDNIPVEICRIRDHHIFCEQNYTCIIHAFLYCKYTFVYRYLNLAFN